MSYATPAQVDRDLGWTRSGIRHYWEQRARVCQEMGDEGICLAQVAKHVPVTIAGLGGASTGYAMGGTAEDVSTALTVTAGLFRDPDGTLRRYGPPIVRAADKHVVAPLVKEIGKATAPYLYKYVIPPVLILYVISGLGAYYSYKTAKRLTPNRRRRRSRRRTSRR